MNRFRSSITKGISVLVTKHGYSRARATALVLERIRQSEESPCEDEIFRVMQHLGLGIESATQIVIVSKSLMKVQDERGYTKAQAIDYLSSCLTTMKLLGSLEKNAAASESPLGSLSTPMAPPSPSIPSRCESEDTINISDTSHHDTAHSDTHTSALPRPKTATKRSSSKTNLKNVKSRTSKPPKPQKKWTKEEDTSNTNSPNPDQEVVEKALLVKEQEVQVRASVGHPKTPSPSVTRHAVGKRASSSNTREHELEVPPQPTKRQRLDSI